MLNNKKKVYIGGVVIMSCDVIMDAMHGLDPIHESETCSLVFDMRNVSSLATNPREDNNTISWGQVYYDIMTFHICAGAFHRGTQ